MKKVLKLLNRHLILIPVILAVFALSFNLNKPFIGHHDFMGAFEGMKARNFAQYGLIELKFGAVNGHITPENSSSKNYSTHYLPLLPILISFAYKLFGVSEAATRLIPLIFSVIGVGAFFLIVRKIFKKQIALIACIFYILNPMFIYFGKLPAPDPPILAMMLVSFYLYLIWQDNPSFRLLGLLILSTLVGGMFGWPFSYFGILVILHAIFTKKFRKQLILIPLTVGFTIFLQFLHNFILTGSFITQEIIDTLKFRLISTDFGFGGVNFNLVNYLKQQVSWLQIYYTRVLIILGGIYILFNLNFKLNLQKVTVFFFLLLGIAHPVIFSRYVFIHDFLNIYLLPFFALAGALGLEKVIIFMTRIRISKSVRYGFMLLILVMFITERQSYTQALFKTQMNLPGQEMGLLLNRLQDNHNQVEIVSPRFESFYGVFSTYYSNYAYGVVDEIDLLKTKDSYHYIIMIDEDIQSTELYQSLTKNYKSDKKNDLTIINLNEKR